MQKEFPELKDCYLLKEVRFRGVLGEKIKKSVNLIRKEMLLLRHANVYLRRRSDKELLEEQKRENEQKKEK